MIDPQLLDLYSTRLKDLGATVKEDRPLAAPQASVRKRSPLCGSEVAFDVVLDAAGRVAEIGWTARACALTEAATAIVVAAAPGSDLAELTAVRAAVKAMLREKSTDLPGGKWADLEVLGPAAEVRARHGSALLPFDTIVAAVAEAAGAT
jgi:NifU-like protein involved in Fe-S cluster formation